MYCSKCGVKIADDAAFCSKCGNKIIRDPEMETTQTPEVEMPQTFEAETRDNRDYPKNHEFGHQMPQAARSILTRPEYGWTDFQLEGTSRYVLSYVDDIAFDWIDQAIHGLETMKPFCVKGFMEPGRVLCTVSYWNCHIIAEDDQNVELEQKNVELEYSHMSMLDFCKCLYEDISNNLDSWVGFTHHRPQGRFAYTRKRALLKAKLRTLDHLIAVREENFGPNRYFY